MMQLAHATEVYEDKMFTVFQTNFEKINGVRNSCTAISPSDTFGSHHQLFYSKDTLTVTVQSTSDMCPRSGPHSHYSLLTWARHDTLSSNMVSSLFNITMATPFSIDAQYYCWIHNVFPVILQRIPFSSCPITILYPSTTPKKWLPRVLPIVSKNDNPKQMNDFEDFPDDDSTKEYKQNIFKLPPDASEDNDDYDAKEMTERLISAWGNDNAYLLGIGLIGLLLVFYVYVYVNNT